MLMDEWVGAGDSEFMGRAKERMQNRVGGSKIVVLASHSVGLLRDVCNKGIVLEGGRLVYSGDIEFALKEYQSVLVEARRAGLELGEVHGEGDGRAETHGAIEDLQLRDGQLHARGWALKGFVNAPPVLALQVGEIRIPAASIEWYPRHDVQRHFGLYDPKCGYRAVFPAPPGLDTLEGFGSPQMFGGDGEPDLDGPFRVGPALAGRLRSTLAPRATDA
jgi:hypothetical protein